MLETNAPLPSQHLVTALTSVPFVQRYYHSLRAVFEVLACSDLSPLALPALPFVAQWAVDALRVGVLVAVVVFGHSQLA